MLEVVLPANFKTEEVPSIDGWHRRLLCGSERYVLLPLAPFAI
jgi:hypothetical protein